MLSADNAHAVHPNYGEKSCPTNRPVLNGGIVIKYSANQKYTTDGDNVSFDGERYELFVEYLTESERTALNEMRSNYAALKEFKEAAEKNELHTKRDEFINSAKYSILAEKNENDEYVNSDFAELVKNMDNYSLADLETQIKILHSDYISTHANFSASQEPEEKKKTSVKYFANPSAKKTKSSRYGNIFDKYKL